jgi:hypothetical protein
VVSLEKAKRESINEDILIDPGIVHWGNRGKSSKIAPELSASRGNMWD